MKHGRIVIGGLLAVLMIVGTCGFLRAHTVKPEDAIPYVAMVKVTRGNLERSVGISAEMNPYLVIDLHAKVAGYLKSINVDIGDRVKAGQVIAQVETPELRADYDNAQSAYLDAKLNYDRINEVNQKQPGLLAQQDVDNAQAAYIQAQAKMERAKTYLDYATITAPFNGVVTDRYADPGAMIQASGNNDKQTMPVVRIAENDRLRLDFPVPEPDVPFVKVGMPIDVTVAATGEKITGVVARTTDTIDPDTRTMRTELDIDNKDLRLTPGMYAYVKLPLEQEHHVLTLPIEAVSLAGQQVNVWKINTNHQIQEVPVSIGLQTANRVEILDGLKDGDEVVYGSRELVNIGMKVKGKLIT